MKRGWRGWRRTDDGRHLSSASVLISESFPAKINPFHLFGCELFNDGFGVLSQTKDLEIRCTCSILRSYARHLCYCISYPTRDTSLTASKKEATIIWVADWVMAEITRVINDWPWQLLNQTTVTLWNLLGRSCLVKKFHPHNNVSSSVWRWW